MNKKQAMIDIASSLAILAGRHVEKPLRLGTEDACQWDGSSMTLRPVRDVDCVKLSLLLGMDRQKEIILANTRQFARGLGSNNALLWGARGMGKSSIIKAVHAEITAMRRSDVSLNRLVLVEIHREDIRSMPTLVRGLSILDSQFLVFCDDLSFESGETDYKALKSILDGGLEGCPPNVLFYATSNRRHLMHRDMIENENRRAIHSREVHDEKISLSDRFGIWLGFHNCDQQTYIDIVNGYCTHFGIKVDESAVHAAAIEWAATRGTRSGRVAMQFVRQLAGESGLAI